MIRETDGASMSRLEIEASGAVDIPSSFGALLNKVSSSLDAHAPHPATLSIVVVYAADFRAAVEEAWTLAGHDFGEFDPERIGGMVHGKAISTGDGGAEAIVVIDGAWWNRCADEPTDVSRRIRLLAHELFHPRLDRLRVEAGVPEADSELLDTPRKGARWMVRTAMDEMRCDLAADAVLSRLLTIELDQGLAPMRFGWIGALAGDSHLGAMVDAFDRVLPYWQTAAHVELPQTRVAALSRVARETGQLLALLGHAEAEARSLGGPGAFGIPENANHPLSTLLEPTWRAICEAYDRHPGWQDLPLAEADIVGDGHIAVVDLWRRLGFEDLLP